jgi:hypothetical protein
MYFLMDYDFFLQVQDVQQEHWTKIEHFPKQELILII